MLLNLGPPSPSVGSHLDFLTKLDRHCGHVELAAAFAYACQDILRQKACRHVSRDAWDLGNEQILKYFSEHCLRATLNDCLLSSPYNIVFFQFCLYS